jgi:hypothetical protein
MEDEDNYIAIDDRLKSNLKDEDEIDLNNFNI